MVAAKTERATVHLTVLGQEATAEVDVPVGPAPIGAALPIARAIAGAVYGVAEAQALAAGKPTTCARGCAACCRHLIPISPIEARALAAWVERQPNQRQARLKKRFAEAVRRLEDAGMLDKAAPKGRAALLLPSAASTGASSWEDVSRRYFELRVDCPLLEEEACSGYAERPLACRAYSATTPPEFCKELSDRVQVLPRPVDMEDALAELESELGGAPVTHLPLVLALEWSKAHAQRGQRLHDGPRIFEALMASIHEETPDDDEHGPSS